MRLRNSAALKKATDLFNFSRAGAVALNLDLKSNGKSKLKMRGLKKI